MESKIYNRYFFKTLCIIIIGALGFTSTAYSQCADVVTGVLESNPLPGGTNCDFVVDITVVPNGGNGNYCFGYTLTANGATMATYESPTGGGGNAGISGTNDFQETFEAACDATIVVTWYSITSAQCNGTQCASGSFEPNVAAPVELLYFSGSSKERSNKLEWATESEENAAAFVVERSFDGINAFQEVGSAEARGFTHSRTVYSLEDFQPLPLSYYRLRAIDFDGTQEVFDIVAVERDDFSSAASFQAAPVPLKMNQPLNVYYSAKTSEKVKLELVDISGKLLYRQEMDLETGMYNWLIDVPQLTGDVLILRIHNREGVEARLIPRINTF